MGCRGRTLDGEKAPTPPIPYQSGKSDIPVSIVIETALRYGCPVWTLNYRDFAAFRGLAFWNPER